MVECVWPADTGSTGRSSSAQYDRLRFLSRLGQLCEQMVSYFRLLTFAIKLNPRNFACIFFLLLLFKRVYVSQWFLSFFSLTKDRTVRPNYSGLLVCLIYYITMRWKLMGMATWFSYCCSPCSRSLENHGSQSIYAYLFIPNEPT